MVRRTISSMFAAAGLLAMAAVGCSTVEFLGVDLRDPQAAGTPATNGSSLPNGAPTSAAGPGPTASQTSSSRRAPSADPLSTGEVRPSLRSRSAMTSPPLPLALLNTPLAASNDRDWSPDQAVLSYAQYSPDRTSVTIRNVRNMEYRTADEYDVHHEDRTYDLSKLKTVDFIRVPFPEMPNLAHTMLSFGFDDQQYLGVSVEIRKQKGETYNPVLASFNKYEIMYVLADERDVIGGRSNYRLYDVYLYPTKATPEQVRVMFDDVMARVNKLYKEPEFYNTITNNCTTAIVGHVNRLAPNHIKYDYRVLLPGYSDRLAYDLGLLKTDLPFDETRRRARINDLAYQYRDSPDFSVAIRRR
jgi:hypothetical protein